MISLGFEALCISRPYPWLARRPLPWLTRPPESSPLTGLEPASIVDNGVQGGQEIKGVDNVLDAAAWTYIAGFAASLMTLLYYVMMVTGMSRSND